MNAYSGTTNLEVMTNAVRYNKFLLSLVLAYAKHGDFIVDLGAGLGTFAEQVAQNGYRVLCVEPDDSQAHAISATGLAVVPDLSAVQKGSVDLLYSLNVLEHVEDDGAMLRDIHARLRPGGRLLLYAPAFMCLFSSMDRQVGHCRRYRRSELARKVAEAGFMVCKSRYADSAGFVVSLIYKLLRRKDGQIDARALRIFDRYVFPLSLAGDRLFGRLFGKNTYVVAAREE